MAELERLAFHRVNPIGTFARLFHWTMIVLTVGLWYPIYWASRKAHGEVK